MGAFDELELKSSLKAVAINPFYSCSHTLFLFTISILVYPFYSCSNSLCLFILLFTNSILFHALYSCLRCLFFFALYILFPTIFLLTFDRVRGREEREREGEQHLKFNFMFANCHEKTRLKVVPLSCGFSTANNKLIFIIRIDGILKSADTTGILVYRRGRERESKREISESTRTFFS